MESARSLKQSTYAMSGRICLLALVILIMALITGCSNMTVVKLAEMCHAEQRASVVSFNGSSGRVECK